MNQSWTPSFSITDFDKRMENAYRRVFGAIGYDLARDLGNTRNLTRSAASALESGLEPGSGPLFLRLGKGALNLAHYRPGGEVDLRGAAGEILREFHEEGKAAFAVARAEFQSGARAYMREAGLDEVLAADALAAADGAFSAPDKEAFTAAALELCNETLAPLTKAVLAGAAVFAPVIALLRSPVLAGVLGIAATGAAYCAIRAGRRKKVERMLTILPRRLYDLLLAGLNTNARRYGETIRAAIRAAQSARGAS